MARITEATQYPVEEGDCYRSVPFIKQTYPLMPLYNKPRVAIDIKVGLDQYPNLTYTNTKSEPLGYKVQVGDYVLIDSSAIEERLLGDSHWLYHHNQGAKQLMFEVTKPPTLYNGGTFYGCRYGALPPVEFLTVISSNYNPSKSGEELKEIEYDKRAQEIMFDIGYTWNDISSDDLKAMKEQLLEQKHEFCIHLESNFTEVRLIKNEKVYETVLEHLCEMEHEYIGSYTEKFWTIMYGRKSFNIPFSLHTWLNNLDEFERGEYMHNTVGALETMARVIIENRWVGETIAYYDGKELNSNGYCIVRDN